MKLRYWLLALFCVAFIPVVAVQAIKIPGLEETARAAKIDQYPTNPEQAVTRIIQWVLSFVGVIFLILMIAGGFTWMTSGGNQESIAKARRTIASAAVGLIIVLSAYAITTYVGGILTTPPIT